MLIHYKPYILSVERGIDPKNDDIASQRVYLNETGEIWFELFDHKRRRYSLDEIRPYLEIKIGHYHKFVEPLTGKYVTKKEYFDM